MRMAVRLGMVLALTAGAGGQALAKGHATSRPAHKSTRASSPPMPSLEPAAGRASWYGWRNGGRWMADGRRFDPLGHSAASGAFPLGTVLLVSNPENGRSDVVTVEDRFGPHIHTRLLDVSLGTARRLGFIREGVVPLDVKRIGFRRITRRDV